MRDWELDLRGAYTYAYGFVVNKGFGGVEPAGSHCGGSVVAYTTSCFGTGHRFVHPNLASMHFASDLAQFCVEWRSERYSAEYRMALVAGWRDACDDLWVRYSHS